MRSRTGLYVMLIFGLFLAAVSMAAKFYLDADSWVAADVVPIEGTVRVSTPPPCPCGCRCPQCPLDACPRCGVAGGYGAAPIAPPWPVAPVAPPAPPPPAPCPPAPLLRYAPRCTCGTQCDCPVGRGAPGCSCDLCLDAPLAPQPPPLFGTVTSIEGNGHFPTKKEFFAPVGGYVELTLGYGKDAQVYQADRVVVWERGWILTVNLKDGKGFVSTLPFKVQIVEAPEA
jgi:hypothetical protein